MNGGGLSEDRLERMDQILAGVVERGDLPGLVALVSRGGETHVTAVGTTEFDGDAPMERDTIFRILSVTKPITAAATMMLVEEGVLRLDDPVDPLLPELANRQVLKRIDGPLDETEPANRPLTLRDLLTFRLGYGAIFTPSPLQEAMTKAGVAPGPVMPELAADDLMAAYGSLPLAHQPGTQWLYNSGAEILGVLIARATGQSLGDVFQERIFTPLGMKDTAFSVPADKLDRFPAAYWTNFETGKREQIDGIEDSRWSRPPVFENGAGGLVSTADDLLAFGEMMLNEGKYGDQRSSLATIGRGDDNRSAHARAEVRLGLLPWLLGQPRLGFWSLGHHQTRRPGEHARALRLGWWLGHVVVRRSDRGSYRHPAHPACLGRDRCSEGLRRFLELRLRRD